MKEIERKFLIKSMPEGVSLKWKIVQGYMPCYNAEMTVRVRSIKTETEEKYFYTTKRYISSISCYEYEHEISKEEFEGIIKNVCSEYVIKKIRYSCDAGEGLEWEIDVFSGKNAGLVVAEIELPSEDTKFEKPFWIGEEVTEDKRYSNSNLVLNGYLNWTK